MSPCFVMPHPVYRGNIYPATLGKLSSFVLACQDFSHDILRELRAAIDFALVIPAPISTFFDHISHVVQLRTRKNVVRTATRWRVAIMKHIHALRDRPDIEFVREAMSSDQATRRGHAELSVPVAVPRTDIKPAARYWLNGNELFESLFDFGCDNVLIRHVNPPTQDLLARAWRKLLLPSAHFYYSTQTFHKERHYVPLEGGESNAGKQEERQG